MTAQQDDQGRDQLVDWVVGSLKAGRTTDSIAKELAQRGADYAQALRFATEVDRQLREATRGHRSGSTVPGWVGALVVFACLNGALYVGQELYHRGDKREAEALKAQLDALNADIASLEQHLTAIERESDDIDGLGARLDAPEVNYSSDAAYEADLVTYNARVDQWNARLPEVAAAGERYRAAIDEYNALVERYNTTADKAYSRWWLIPMPGGRHVDVPPRVLTH